jgi:hypothetical protein
MHGCTQFTPYSQNNHPDNFDKQQSHYGWGFWHKREWERKLKCQNTHSGILKSCMLLARYIACTIIFQTLLLLGGDIHPNPGPMKTDVKICHANIRSIRSNKTKLDHISCSLADEYDIITLSETWLIVPVRYHTFH